jgi:hypothetical protein
VCMCFYSLRYRKMESRILLKLTNRKKKKKNADKVKNYWHGLGKGCLLCTAPPKGCRATQHLRIKRGGACNGDQMVRRHGPAHHQDYAQIFLRVCLQCHVQFEQIMSHLSNFFVWPLQPVAPSRMVRKVCGALVSEAAAA